jgi:hypothetical protein
MTYEEARAVLAAAIQEVLAVMPGISVFWDNADVIDLEGVKGDVVLKIEFYWDGAAQVELAERPHHRVAGSVWFTVLAREHSGSRAALALADRLTDALKFRNLMGLVTRVPRPGRREAHDGWASQEWLLPFTFTGP